MSAQLGRVRLRAINLMMMGVSAYLFNNDTFARMLMDDRAFESGKLPHN